MLLETPCLFEVFLYIRAYNEGCNITLLTLNDIIHHHLISQIHFRYFFSNSLVLMDILIIQEELTITTTTNVKRVVCVPKHTEPGGYFGKHVSQAQVCIIHSRSL